MRVALVELPVAQLRGVELRGPVEDDLALGSLPQTVLVGLGHRRAVLLARTARSRERTAQRHEVVELQVAAASSRSAAPGGTIDGSARDRYDRVGTVEVEPSPKQLASPEAVGEVELVARPEHDRLDAPHLGVRRLHQARLLLEDPPRQGGHRLVARRLLLLLPVWYGSPAAAASTAAPVVVALVRHLTVALAQPGLLVGVVRRVVVAQVVVAVVRLVDDVAAVRAVAAAASIAAAAERGRRRRGVGAPAAAGMVAPFALAARVVAAPLGLKPAPGGLALPGPLPRQLPPETRPETTIRRGLEGEEETSQQP